MLKDAEVAIRMYGKSAWRDNVFVERLWQRVIAFRPPAATEQSGGACMEGRLEGSVIAQRQSCRT